jgi:hypothetical protein
MAKSELVVVKNGSREVEEGSGVIRNGSTVQSTRKRVCVVKTNDMARTGHSHVMNISVEVG